MYIASSPLSTPPSPQSNLDCIQKVYIEPTTHCNFSCHMCFRHSWFDESFMHMPYELFHKTLAGIPSTAKTIMFGGMGEPLLHPNILDMIGACKEKGHAVEIITNGALLSHSLIQGLLHCQLDKIWISLDNLQDRDNTPLPGHPNIRQILHNIAQLNMLRAAHGHSNNIPALSLGIAFVVCAENIAQLKTLPLFMAQYQIDHISISNMKMKDAQNAEDVLYNRTINMRLGSQNVKRPTVSIPYMDFDRPDVQDALQGLFSSMNFTPYIGDIPIPRKTQYCKFVEEGMVFVRSDGKVSPCMELLHNGTAALGHTDRTIFHHSFGTIHEQSLEFIWQSPEYTAFRNKVKAFSFSPCTHCGHCQESESNLQDCYGNEKPCCGGCLWAEGLLSCP